MKQKNFQTRNTERLRSELSLEASGEGKTVHGRSLALTGSSFAVYQGAYLNEASGADEGGGEEKKKGKKMGAKAKV